jgi:hypothetical protein
MVVFLDTGVLDFLTNPTNSAEPTECKQWLDGILAAGAEVRVPEVADYELRRELIRNNSAKPWRGSTIWARLWATSRFRLQ